MCKAHSALALEELRVLIEDRLDIDLDEVALTSRDTVGALVSAVDGKVAGPRLVDAMVAHDAL